MLGALVLDLFGLGARRSELGAFVYSGLAQSVFEFGAVFILSLAQVLCFDLQCYYFL